MALVSLSLRSTVYFTSWDTFNNGPEFSGRKSLPAYSHELVLLVANVAEIIAAIFPVIFMVFTAYLCKSLVGSLDKKVSSGI